MVTIITPTQLINRGPIRCSECLLLVTLLFNFIYCMSLLSQLVFVFVVSYDFAFSFLIHWGHWGFANIRFISSSSFLPLAIDLCQFFILSGANV